MITEEDALRIAQDLADEHPEKPEPKITPIKGGWLVGFRAGEWPMVGTLVRAILAHDGSVVQFPPRTTKEEVEAELAKRLGGEPEESESQ